jgi:RimJ/RimL family protein N-acetyltransferase
MTHDGEWGRYDAPWENSLDSLTAERLDALGERFLKRCTQDLPCPRTSAMIADRTDRPLGWVGSYTLADVPDTRYVGIDICEDDCLNQGLGTEALGLWIDYLFVHTDLPRLGLETWSFNPRMIRVAEKLGFVLENVKRQAREWQGQQLDLLQFSLLRSAWEALGRENGCEQRSG